MANGRLGLRTRPGIISSYTEIIAFDSDANAFIQAAGITNDTEKTAINQLVFDLKFFKIWSKLKACYPFVGGSATSHKFNLINPLDTDFAYRLVFFGGWTHASTGATPNGTTGYADTFFTPNLLNQNSVHLSYYSRTDVSGSQVEIGSADYVASPVRPLYILYRFNNTNYKALNNVDLETSVLFTPTTGLLIGSRINSTNIKFYHKGLLAESLTANSTTPNNLKIPIAAQRQSTTLLTNYSSKQCAFASIGDGLTDQEALNFYNIVQNFQTTLGRQV